jgi:hypothetical protein
MKEHNFRKEKARNAVRFSQPVQSKAALNKRTVLDESLLQYEDYMHERESGFAQL